MSPELDIIVRDPTSGSICSCCRVDHRHQQVKRQHASMPLHGQS